MSVIYPSDCENIAGESGRKTFPPTAVQSRDFTYTSCESDDSPFASSASANDALASFCPSIISYLALNELTSMSARTFTFPAFCMLADISGFTKLSSDLCDRGAAGLDELRQVTSSIFGTIVDLVTSHGGDVLYFAGDALICIFQDVYTPFRFTVPAADRVTACATSIQKIRTSLKIHSAISTGDINLSILGGVGEQWSYVINGSCVAELAQCLDDAGPRETVVTPLVVEALYQTIQRTDSGKLKTKNGFRVRQLPSGNYCVLETRPLSPQSLSGGSDDVRMLAVPTSFVPPPALNAIYSSTVADLAELRNITTLFMKLDSYCPAEHKDLTSLQPFYYAMQEIIFECGGYIRQFIIDDKGCVLIVLWGVPTASFPNNCSRSIRCAASMAAKTASLSHACSIGITTGTAYCGTVGSSHRQDYVAIGKTVNLAARLMIKANGGILLDETTRDCLATGVAAACIQLQPLKLKGFDNPVSCYRYLSTSVPDCDVAVDRRHASNVFVTTRDVTVTISRILGSASCMAYGDSTESIYSEEHKSNAEYFIINGPIGYGKSTFANNLGLILEEKGHSVLKIALTKQHENAPFAVLRELFLLLVGSNNFDSPRKQKEFVWDLLERCYPDEDVLELSASRFPILQCILQLNWSGSIATKSANYYEIIEADNSTMMDVLAYLLKKKKVTGIIIDNAHLMCGGSWNQLAYFALNSVPVLIVLTVLDQTVVEGDTPVSSAYVGGTEPVVKSTLRHPRHGLHSTTNKDNTSKAHNSANNHSFVIGYLCDVATTHILNLQGLNEVGIHRVIESRIAPAAVPREIVKKVNKLSRGNPFWVSELAKVIDECGIEAFTKLVSKGIEHNLLATCILSRYTSAQCSVLKVASVLGREFRADLLCAIVTQEIKPALSRIIFELVEAGIIRYVENDVYRFQSSLLSDAIYSLFPPSTASAIHFEVAKAIETCYIEDLTDHVAALAYHYSMSPKEHRQHAFSHAIKAADNLSAQFAFSDALNYLQLGFDVATSPGHIKTLHALVDRNVEMIEFLRSSSARQKTSGLLNNYIHFMKLKDLIERRSARALRERENVLVRTVKRLVCGGRVAASIYSSDHGHNTD